ncbi:MAG: hypothetical protein HZB66_01205 [Candidatus Aenigmarchaeota archaeon]|nr:hypothetical protein [Candidatus Aenigmarchaeota archaeon]
MKVEHIFSRDFLDRYANGEREFSGISLQFADISVNLKDVTIRDSKLFFVTFFGCNIVNVRFINCEIFYGSFNGGGLENTIFDNCNIDFTIFHNGLFKNVKILRSKLSWCAIFSRPVEELDISKSECFKIFRNVSEITDRDVEEAMSRLGPVISSMDFSIKVKIKEELHKGAADYGVNVDKTGIEPSYEGHAGGHYRVASGYGANLQNLISSVIRAYNAVHPYVKKRGYDNTELKE